MSKIKSRALVTGFSLLIIGTLFSFLSFKTMNISEDLVESMSEDDHSLVNGVQSKYYAKGYFSNLIFVAPVSSSSESNSSGNSDKIRLIDKMKDSGYLPYNPIDINTDNINYLLPLARPGALEEWLHEKNIASITDNFLSLISLPGGDEAIGQFKRDPLQLQTFFTLAALNILPDKNAKGNAAPNNPVLIFKRSQEINYEAVGKVYDFLKEKNDSFKVIGSDLFAFENYQAIKGDIKYCSMLAIALNVILFFFFCPNWGMLVILVLGTWLSFSSSSIVLNLVFPVTFSLVYAFTSTFIGFNNEYLIHMSQISGKGRRKKILGLISALGTTFIGFVVLAFSESEIVRQMAIISIAGMVSFLLVMIVFQDYLKNVRYRLFDIPKIPLRVWHLGAIMTGLMVLSFSVFKVDLNTDITNFRYHSKWLEGNQNYFSSGAIFKTSQDKVAVVVPETQLRDLLQTVYQTIGNDSVLNVQQLVKWQDAMSQNQRIIRAGVNKLQSYLGTTGVEIDLHDAYTNSPELEAILQEGSRNALLEKVNDALPFPIVTPLKHDMSNKDFNLNQDSYILYLKHSQWLDVEQQISAKLNVQVADLSVRNRFNTALTYLEKNMLMLFGFGVVVMFFFLWAVQRKLSHILYIFCPLVLSVASLLMLLQVQGREFNFIMTMGFCLVIALALDYTSIAVSNSFCRNEQSKILLSGMSSVLTFGVLATAEHPVLRDLGFVVSVGSALSLIFAVLFTLKGHEIPQEEAAN